MVTAPKPATPLVEEALPGRVIAERYRLVAPVGTGGMATVWRAQHLTLDQPVALKFIEVAGMDVGRMRERFLREARVAAAVRHRNVVDILDFGTSAEGQPFMAMELLEGETLADRMTRSPPMTVAETVGIVARVLSGLGAVHDAGIVHRDLKPENVHLVRDADGVYPKLIDFGVSRSVDRTGGIKSVLPTVENAIVGTPQYMSPEQARGVAGVDHRSDLWSVGVLLYELLTGRLPYDGEGAGDVIIKIATETPVRFATLRPDLAGPLERVVEKAMERDPEARFGHAREMRAALLAAAAKTATRLTGDVAGRPDVDTQDDVDPAALLDAVGDAYEKGDSGLIDMAGQSELIEELFPDGGRGVTPPPAPARLAEDPFELADRSEASTLSDDKPRSRGWIALLGVFGAVALALAAVGGMVALRPEPAESIVATELDPEPAPRPADPTAAPAPPSELPGLEEPAPSPAANVVVRLGGLPPGAEVRVDGAPWPHGERIELARDDAPHAIEVRHRGRAWRVTHIASEDGAYEVELPRAAAPSRAPRRGSTPQGTSGRTEGRGGDLIRTPGF